MAEPLWTPSESRIENARITQYAEFLKERYGHGFEDYDDMWEWSTSDPGEFWASIWDFFDVVSSELWNDVLVNGNDMLEAEWFTGARLNFAENLLRWSSKGRFGTAGTGAKEALVFTSENGVRKAVSYDELWDLVSGTARALKASGVVSGDRVAGFMPNMIEAVVAMLATTSIGAVWSSCSPDFGIKGVMDRFGQIEPKVLFTADGYNYNGKTFDSLERVSSIVDDIPSIRRVVVVPYASGEPDISIVRDSILFEDLMGAGPSDLEFEQLPFDHPVYIMYSSGTTGVPKCIVHGAGGTLIQHMKELGLHTDVKAEDRVFYFTTCGWMMWNWLVSALSLGATVLLFDGNPFYPDEGRLFELADRERMTVFGTSARYLSAVEKSGLKPRDEFDLSSLRAVCSTGSPLSHESFEFVYEHIKEDLQLASIAGGTDIISCFGLGNPTLPVYPSELQVRGLGMKVDAFDAPGRPVRGVQGELVCTAPFPSRPIYFWNDPDKERYRSAYYDVYPGVWRHGDFVEITEHNGLIFYGRSDATLNPGGVRIGTAEIYRQVMSLDEIKDSIVVGQDWDDDTRVVLFVVLQEGSELDDDLVGRIKGTIRSNTTPRHVPARILEVPDIPRTISGKKVELAVRQVIHGKEVLNRDALANPEALEHFRKRMELES